MLKKIDDIGRIAIPKDLRRSLHWMGGDEIEIVDNGDGSITLRKYDPDFTKKIINIRDEFISWASENNIALDKVFSHNFEQLIEDIQKREGKTN